MKKLFSLTFLMLLAAANLFAQGMAKKHAPEPNSKRKSPHDTVKGNHIKITYGRPYKKGRVLFGTQEEHDNKKALEVYGKVWRAGADEATQITVDKDCTFGGKKLKAGTYTLFATPNEKNWEIILNGQLDQWGAFSYDKYKDKDVLHTTVPVKHLKKEVEQWTISIMKNGLQMEWGNISVSVPVKF